MSQVAWVMGWLGATYGELGLAALLVALVLLAPVAPRIGEAIGARLGKRG
jgi:hypothetical protein